MKIEIDARGLEQAARQLDPKRAPEILQRWYDRATGYVRDEMRARARGRLKEAVRITSDGGKPPKWARIRPHSRLTHLTEYGTGRAGSGGVRHVGRHWPNPEKLAEATGLPLPEAFLVARAIGERGGNPPRPFVGPTALAIRGPVERMAEEAAAEVLK